MEWVHVQTAASEAVAITDEIRPARMNDECSIWKFLHMYREQIREQYYLVVRAAINYNVLAVYRSHKNALHLVLLNYR